MDEKIFIGLITYYRSIQDARYFNEDSLKELSDKAEVLLSKFEPLCQGYQMHINNIKTAIENLRSARYYRGDKRKSAAFNDGKIEITFSMDRLISAVREQLD
ncbi:MAG: hypothetical protein BGO69_11300 [Bacteroidetes bacterium 46-16]|nr:MAG: hypothetical protein BGO69_11300 [Bacteroidetes bacterium 46-16]